MGVSLWQPISYDEAELLITEILADPSSRLCRAIASTPEPVDVQQDAETDETLEHYREVYGL